MDITINITHEDILFNPSIIDSVKVLGQKLSGGVSQNTVKETKTENPRVGMNNSPEVLQETPVEEPKQEVLEQDKPSFESETQKYTVEEVRKALGDLSKSKGAPAAKGVLKAFNVSKVTELKESDYGDVMLAVKAVG